MNDAFKQCADAPFGVVTNCVTMDCEGQGCALAAVKTRPPGSVSLDDLVAPAAPRSPFSPPTGEALGVYEQAIRDLLGHHMPPDVAPGRRRSAPPARRGGVVSADCGICSHRNEAHQAANGGCEVRYVDGARCYCPGYRAAR